jgi:hypothetical protein
LVGGPARATVERALTAAEAEIRDRLQSLEAGGPPQ